MAFIGAETLVSQSLRSIFAGLLGAPLEGGVCILYMVCSIIENYIKENQCKLENAFPAENRWNAES